MRQKKISIKLKTCNFQSATDYDDNKDTTILKFIINKFYNSITKSEKF